VGDPAKSDRPVRTLTGRLGLRERIKRKRTLRLAYRIAVGVLGGAVLLAGIFLIPYPGPGWLIVFAGLAILATEFSWAERVLRYVKGRYDGWTDWVGRQHLVVRVLVWLATAVVVVVTLWLIDVFDLVGGWFKVDWEWLSSPFL
jgi:uncharacterized protein (TIGR02611 family)